MPVYFEFVAAAGVVAAGSATTSARYAPVNTRPACAVFAVRPWQKANEQFRANPLNNQSSGLVHWWNFKLGADTASVYDAVAESYSQIIYDDDPADNWIVDGTRGGFVYTNSGTAYVESEAQDLDGATQATFSAWVYMDSLTQKMAVLSKNDDDQNGIVFGWDDVNGWNVRQPNGNGEQAWTGTTGFVANRWYHLAVVFNGGLTLSSNRLKVYVNGVRQVLIFSGSIADTILPSGSGVTLKLGATTENGTLYAHWLGRLDDVRHYNRALSNAEVGILALPGTSPLSVLRPIIAVTDVPYYEGVIGGGTAPYSVLISVGKGGPLAGGTAPNTGIFTADISTAGPVVGGDAFYVASYMPQGGVYGDGSADISGTYVMLGGVYGDGNVVPYGITNEPPFGQPTSGVWAGTAAAVAHLRVFSYAPDGNVVLVDGSASAAITSIKFVASGGPETSGEARVNFAFVNNTTFYWHVRSKIEGEFVFYWNVGRLKMFWYRVVSKPLDGNGCPIIGPNCCQKFVVNIHARSIGELCDKLRSRRLRFPIQSVERFSRPAETSESLALEAAGIDQSCQELIPVEICSVPQCAEFCLDIQRNQGIGFGMKAQVDAFKEHVASGSAVVTGAAPATLVRFIPDFPFVASGGVTLELSAFYQTDSYAGRGGALAGGAAFSQSSRWSYVGGEWPNARAARAGTTNESVAVLAGDVAWQLPERVNLNDSLYSQSDISFGKSSESLVTYGFGSDLPTWASIMGVRMYVNRVATQVGVRDLEVYLVRGGERISDNMAVTGIDWPLISTVRVYGSTGLDGNINWRDPDDDHYAGPLTVEDLNDPTFGVEIRVKANASLINTIAKIDYIFVEVFYEDATGSIVRTGGEAGTRSVRYHYAGSGRTVVDSSIVIRRGYRFQTTGLGLTGDGEVSPGGSAALTYTEPASGGGGLGGAAKVTPYFEEMAGGGIGGGAAKVTPYLEPMSGGAGLGGAAMLGYRFHFTASGGTALASLNYMPGSSFRTSGAGGPVLGSDVQVRSSNWTWVSDGAAVFVIGGAVMVAGNQTPPDTDIGFGMSVLQTSATFVNDTDLQDAESLTSTVNKCDCDGIPLIIELSQNFATGNLLSKFLVRNNQSPPRTLRLRYNEPNDSWQCNLHYRGQSAEGTHQEAWDMTFELQCTNLVGGIGIGKTIWKLSAQIFRRNLTTRALAETRVLVGLIPDGICASNGLNFNVNYNTQLGLAVVRPGATVYQSTIYDNIGLFKNPTWISNPNLVLRISQVGAGQPTRRIDLTDAVLV